MSGSTRVIVEKDVEVEMRDGTMLRADVYRPDSPDQHPVLIQRTPYNKNLFGATTLTVDPLRAVAAGYAVVIQDVRGRWASEGGPFYLYRDEPPDSFDTIAWAAEQPFSNGSVAQYGVSYMGGTAWQAASLAPPQLRAIAAATAPAAFGNNHLRRGGALQLGLLLMWAHHLIGPNALIRARGGQALGPLLADLADEIDDYDAWVRHLPPSSFPPGRPDDGEFLPFLFETMAHPMEDAFGDSILSVDHGSIRVPALIVAGWHDLLLASDLEHFAAMSRSATEEARQGTRMIIGPWSHGAFSNVVGELDFGVRASGALIDLREDLTALHLRWFDRWLKGREPDPLDSDARVRLFVQGSKRWRDEDEWPLRRARPTRWYFGAEGALSRKPPDGADGFDTYTYDPIDPCPTRGGNILMPLTYPRGPVDQRSILGRSDVLTYLSDPLRHATEVTGKVTCVLHASSDARDTDWVVKLCDARSDGSVMNVCDGILRARFRRSLEHQSLLTPNEVERYEIDLWATSWVFGPGHCILVVVTSSDFPRYDRNPNTGEHGVDATRTKPARQRVFHDASRASHVVLPLIAS